jgi:hypothetical protein
VQQPQQLAQPQQAGQPRQARQPPLVHAPRREAARSASRRAPAPVAPTDQIRAGSKTKRSTPRRGRLRPSLPRRPALATAASALPQRARGRLLRSKGLRRSSATNPGRGGAGACGGSPHNSATLAPPEPPPQEDEASHPEGRVA